MVIRGSDKVVYRAVRNRLFGLGIECQWLRDFLYPSRPALGLTQTSVNSYHFPFPGLPRKGHGGDHTFPSTVEAKERVELHLYSPSGRVKFDYNNILRIIMSDEAYFHLNGTVNKQNLRYWAAENPRDIHERPLHSARVTLVCGCPFWRYRAVFFRGRRRNSDC